MTKISIEGKELPIVCDNYMIRQLGIAINELTPDGVFSRYSEAAKKENVSTFESMDLNAKLVFEMLKRGAKKSGNELDIDLSDCYDALKDEKTVYKFVTEMTNYLPDVDTLPKKKAAVKA
jgi:hypothetical protein